MRAAIREVDATLIPGNVRTMDDLRSAWSPNGRARSAFASRSGAGAVAAALLTVALLAAVIPAARVLRVDPIKTLRCD